MNSWSETIQLSKPLRDAVALTGGADGAGARWADLPTEEDRRQAELNASYQRGLADGEKALTEKLYQQRAEMHELTRGLLESLRNAVPQVVRDTENSLVSLALTVAQKLVADMPISVEMVEAVVRDALAQMEGTARFTVRLHRDDLELLQKAGSPLLKPGENPTDCRFLPSPDVTRGGCVVETDFGTIDARRETKLDLLQRSLTP
jgi:flagellar biosynthesis/type III secretory pathway protein FliH